MQFVNPLAIGRHHIIRAEISKGRRLQDRQYQYNAMQLSVLENPKT